MITERSRAAHCASAELLASRAREALRGAGGSTIVASLLQEAAGHTDGTTAAPGPVPAAGAVRRSGADALAPYLLTGRTPPPEETAAVRLILAALPPAPQPPAAPPRGPEPPWTRAWIDWGLVTVLARLDAGAPPVPAPMPAGPPCYDGTAPRHRSAAQGGAGEGWVPWALRMGQLASLALPGLDTPVHQAAHSGAEALARGATRSLLRRDFATAARLTRWLAWLAADGAALPLDAALLVEDIALRGGGNRCLLDVAICRHLLGLEGA
ncbi:hypothetical protein [Streptomyces sp. S.PNR 29]|uniref:hypothetical protein n=1 Tax=Streptomyces sp. S.PNR 29 TaxID=2973805 RepID=UPI0025AF74AF|nr:hypothetical protein [Streptomyces sp. S.PNR 29]MDN0193562.1 hypothetical protein [Streptomyces sp. S.PNR 29]